MLIFSQIIARGNPLKNEKKNSAKYGISKYTHFSTIKMMGEMSGIKNDVVVALQNLSQPCGIPCILNSNYSLLY